jgi:hypothetical protein
VVFTTKRWKTDRGDKIKRKKHGQRKVKLEWLESGRDFLTPCLSPWLPLKMILHLARNGHLGHSKHLVLFCVLTSTFSSKIFSWKC